MVPKTNHSILVSLSTIQPKMSISVQLEKELHYYRARKKDGKIIGYEYRNYAACKKCGFKDRCTKTKKGRSICRHVDQDFIDRIDLQTKRKVSVSTEISLSFLAYNLKRAINILGTEEILRKLRQRRKVILA